MKRFRLTGLCAATVTPFNEHGGLHLEQVEPLVSHLVQSGVSGLYVCGSTGEGSSLTVSERKAVGKAYVDAANGRVPVILQVGHNSLSAAAELAAHAAKIGADGISALSPSYFAIDNIQVLIDSIAQVADSAPELPFYYYHIPRLTNVVANMVEFLGKAAPRIPNLVGVKFSSTALNEYQHCLEFDDGQFDIMWGVDEMLLAAWATGATGAVGSTYNIAAPAYLQVIEAFERGDIDTARQWQSRACALVRLLASMPFHAALREVLKQQGLDCGLSRLPLPSLNDDQTRQLNDGLAALDFFDWSAPASDISSSV